MVSQPSSPFRHDVEKDGNNKFLLQGAGGRWSPLLPGIGECVIKSGVDYLVGTERLTMV